MPFFIAASLLIALAAGAKSNWRTQADVADENTGTKKVQGEEGPPERWYAWLLKSGGGTSTIPPKRMTDAAAAALESGFRKLGADVTRFVQSASGEWLVDERTNIGAQRIEPAEKGPWPLDGCPAEVSVKGRKFKRSKNTWAKKGVVAQYREDVPRNSMHMCVLRNRTYIIDHTDDANPDHPGQLMAHFIEDVLKPMRKTPPALPASTVGALKDIDEEPQVRIDRKPRVIGATNLNKQPLRWFYWYVDAKGQGTQGWGPYSMTDFDAYNLSTQTRIQNPRVTDMRRYVAVNRTWTRDTRSNRDFLAAVDPKPATSSV